MLNELNKAGYLTAQVRGHVGDRRTTEMRENVDETKRKMARVIRGVTTATQRATVQAMKLGRR